MANPVIYKKLMGEGGSISTLRRGRATSLCHQSHSLAARFITCHCKVKQDTENLAPRQTEGRGMDVGRRRYAVYVESR